MPGVSEVVRSPSGNVLMPSQREGIRAGGGEAVVVDGGEAVVVDGGEAVVVDGRAERGP